MRTRTLLPILLALCVSRVPAQLPLLTAPRGTLRIEFGGGFFPATSAFADGRKRDLGEPLTLGSINAAATPLLGDLESRLAEILGRPANSTGLGGITTVAERQRGVATIGLALGVTRRITVSGTVPIVSVRSQRALTYDPSGATVGLNPADPNIGDAAGRARTTAFFTELDAAIATLTTKYNRGDYATDPTAQALAQQTLSDAPALRSSLYTLLMDSVRASAVLPTDVSADGAALLTRVTTLRNKFTSGLGIAGFTGVPALPTTTITAAGFDALLAAPTGFGLLAPEDRPIVGLGDIEGAVTIELIQHGRPGDASWLGFWMQGLGRFPTGQLARPQFLFDQGTGDRQIDAEVAGIVELGRHRLGLRAEGRYVMQLASDHFARIGGRDQLLIPAYRTAGVHHNPGDIIAVTVQPFFRLAPRLAFTGLVSYQRRGADATSYVTGQNPVGGAAAAILDAGTGADATIVGAGFSYVHDGRHRDGILRMPVEAGLSVERTVRSGSGVVPATLTSRLVFRVYKALVRQ
ncbi:MAG: hypothetical protein ABIZ70_03570 [Gemmatimonadales bacterium]